VLTLATAEGAAAAATGVTAYAWLLSSAPVSTVATYAYVNPVVAVALGWAFLGEPLSAAVVGGAALILAAVVLSTSRRPAAPSTPEPEGVPLTDAAEPAR